MASRRPVAPRGPRRGGGAPSGARPETGSRPEAGTRRPAAAARPRSTPAPDGPQAPRGLTRRAAVFAILVLVAAVAVAPYLRTMSEQQAALSALEEDVADRERHVAELESELSRWQDPAFVQARARERLMMVMPGETGYVVVDPPPPPEAADAAAAATEAVEVTGQDRPWFGTLWESVELAGAHAPAVLEPAAGDDGSSPAPSVPPATP